jgi:hypothetical protein
VVAHGVSAGPGATRYGAHSPAPGAPAVSEPAAAARLRRSSGRRSP